MTDDTKRVTVRLFDDDVIGALNDADSQSRLIRRALRSQLTTSPTTDVVADGGIDTETLQLVEGMDGATINADTPMVDIQLGASDAALRALLDDLLAYFEGDELAVGDKWRDNGGEQS